MKRTIHLLQSRTNLFVANINEIRSWHSGGIMILIALICWNIIPYFGIFVKA